jgi:hypothetical protein
MPTPTTIPTINPSLFLDLLPAGITIPIEVEVVVVVLVDVDGFEVVVVVVLVVVVVDVVVVREIQAPWVQVPGSAPLVQEVPSTKLEAE